MTRILVVEDSRTQAEAARAVLEEAGYEVEVAPDGAAGLERLRETTFDLVISDVVMPRMGGYELSRTVKNDSKLKHVPVILLTTLNDPMDIIQGLESSADNFITKPYEREYLVERVRTLLENRALRSSGKLTVGVEISFLGKRFTVTSDREQILDLLIATFEDIVRTNRHLQETKDELAAANQKVEEYARALEGRVRHSEEKYRNLMEQAGEAILIFDQDGVLLELNERATQLLGRAISDVPRRNISEIVGAEASRRFEKFMNREAVESEAFDVERPDRTKRSVECSFSAADFDNEHLVLAIVRDVTEKKEMENRIRQAEKMEAVARLASGAAHDFNNVLMAIMTFADVILRRLAADDAAKEAVNQIKSAAKRGSWLTSQLLAFSRGRQAAGELVDFNGVLREMTGMLKNLAGESVEIAMNLADAEAPVSLQAGQVEQIAMNLVVNARDAMKGHGSVTVHTERLFLKEPWRLGLPAAQPGEYVRLSVSDTGQGMSGETRARLFEPFFTTKERGRGTGLGLAIVHAIVTEHEGSIGVDSEAGKGTTFAILLPLSHTPEQPVSE